MGGTLGGFLLIRGGTVLRGGAGTGGKRFFLIFFFSLDKKYLPFTTKPSKPENLEMEAREKQFFSLCEVFSVLFSFGFFLDVLGFFYTSINRF